MICRLCGVNPVTVGCQSVDGEFIGPYPMPLCDECHARLHRSPLLARLFPFTPLALVHSN